MTPCGVAVVYICIALICNASAQKFPKNFEFGTATAAYQIEGAWNVDGKSESIWDYYTHTFPNFIHDKSNGDVACDSYHKTDEDIANLKKLNVDFYRFSLSFARIMPTGFPNKINKLAVAYYNQIIDKLIKNGIKPVATIYHWDMPQTLQELGGWTNPLMSNYFAEFARVCFRLFGDRIKTWITINEPASICFFGYEGGIQAPFVVANNVGNYLCAHHLILGHAQAYHIYQNEFKAVQKGRIGITIESPWVEPNTTNDRHAAEAAIQFHFGIYAHPIFSSGGDYPEVVRRKVNHKSAQQGYHHSRLPYFTPQQIKFVRGSADFLGLNHYSTYIGTKALQKNNTAASMYGDAGVQLSYSNNWTPTARYNFKVVPWGIRKLLDWIKKAYNNPEVAITENGYAGGTTGGTIDKGRVEYLNGYLIEISKAINIDGCNVTGYTYWSFMDNFEWVDGYTIRFGLFHVDFIDPNRPRTPKMSAFVYQQIIHTHEVNTSFTPTNFLH